MQIYFKFGYKIIIEIIFEVQDSGMNIRQVILDQGYKDNKQYRLIIPLTKNNLSGCLMFIPESWASFPFMNV
jgi:hypothetical protein